MNDKTNQPALPASTTAAAPAPKVMTRASIESMMMANQHKMVAAMGATGLTMERFVRIVLLCVDKNPDLLKCTQASLVRCIMQCASLGLEPGDVRGLAYLIPYKVKGADLNRTCELIVGYRGFIELARKSTLLKQIEARVVHENDVFEVRFGFEPTFTHRPVVKGDRGPPIAGYCIAELPDGYRHVEVMTWDEILTIRSRSKSSGDGPWVTDTEEMARKTVVRRAAKYLPMSPEMADAAEHFDVVDSVATEVTAPPPPKAKKKNGEAHALPADTGAQTLAEPEEQPEAVTASTADEKKAEVKKALDTITNSDVDKQSPPPVEEKAPAIDDDLAQEVRVVTDGLMKCKTKKECAAWAKRINNLPEPYKGDLRPVYNEVVGRLP